MGLMVKAGLGLHAMNGTLHNINPPLEVAKSANPCLATLKHLKDQNQLQFCIQQEHNHVCQSLFVSLIESSLQCYTVRGLHATFWQESFSECVVMQLLNCAAFIESQ